MFGNVRGNENKIIVFVVRCWCDTRVPDRTIETATFFTQPKLPGGVYPLIRYNKIMMRTGKTLALALSSLTFSSGVLALTSDSPSGPYHGIVERNIFDIHAAPPPPKVDPEANRPPPPNVRLQGIVDILGRKQVLFKVQLPPKPPAPAKEESFILTVGERQGEIEVLNINPKAGTVQMKVYGVVTNLSLELNSDKLINVAPVVAPTPPNPAQMMAPGTIAPPPTLPGLPAGKFPRTLRLPGSNGAQNQSDPGSPGSYGGSYGGANQNQQQADLGHEQQIINMAAQKLQAQKSKDPKVRAMGPIIPLPPDIQKEFDNQDQPQQAQ